MFKRFAKLDIIQPGVIGRKVTQLVWFAFGACLCWAAPAAAQYPGKPIRFIVPYAPGSSPDAICRLIGAELARQMGQQFVIDNKPEIGRAHV